jgi:tetratricopeptide (TPR) repeat protein
MSKIDDLMQQGLALHQSGQLAEADAVYGKVLARQPSHPAANHLRGVLLLQQGDAAGAVHLLQRSVHLRGENAEYLGNLGAALNAAGRHQEALSVFERSLKLQPNDPGVRNNHAMALKALGRLDPAIAAYRTAITLRPQEPGFYRNLANALSEMGEWHEAEANYRKALELRPNFPNALTGHVNSLLALHRRDEAIQTAAAAATHFPQHSEFHRALGHAYWQSGNPAAAAAAYRAALAANPADVEAHRLLGLIVVRSEVDKEVQAVQALLDQPALSIDSRAELFFTLAQAYDDIGDGDRAAEYFRAGNALVRQSRPFDLDRALSEMQSLQDAFESLPDADVPPLEPPSGPIFIIGLPRSGKSTLEGRLARHPELYAAGELAALANLAGSLAKEGVIGAPERRDAAGSAELGRRFLAMSTRLAPGKRVLDTMPNNFHLVGAIRLAMPGARVVHCTRDPRAHMIALHQKYYSQTGNEYAADLEKLVAFHAAYRDLMAFWSRRFPGLIVDIDVTAPGSSAQTLSHLGLSGHPHVNAPFVSEPRLSSGHTPRQASAAALAADLDVHMQTAALTR